MCASQLKLYCECFASGNYCFNCNCHNCSNNGEHEAARNEAVNATLERNPHAFRPKIASDGTGGELEGVARHNKGCHCKKSGCLKKYCECFQAGVLCTAACRVRSYAQPRRPRPPARRAPPRPPRSLRPVHGLQEF